MGQHRQKAPDYPDGAGRADFVSCAVQINLGELGRLLDRLIAFLR
jgi:hypothetical protein